MRVCVVTSPRTKAGIRPLSNLIDVLSSFCMRLYLVTGDEGESVYKTRGNVQGYSILGTGSAIPRANLISKIVGFICLQLRSSYMIAKLRPKTDIYMFFMGEGLLLAVLTAKLLGRKVILSLAASPSMMDMANKGINISSKPLKPLEILNYAVADRIIIYSPRLIKEWKLHKHIKKIVIAHEHFIDFNRLIIHNSLSERDNVVGYIGRISVEKGVESFVEAIPQILSTRDDTTFLIAGGEGPLVKQVTQYLDDNHLNIKVRFLGWIPYVDLPAILNELKLVVLPSYTEGLPNVMLEAMACGTPVLATPVGAIPDVITDGETGFLMDNNSPEAVAKHVIGALNYPNLKEITEKALALVEMEFTYEAAVQSYKKALGVQNL